MVLRRKWETFRCRHSEPPRLRGSYSSQYSDDFQPRLHRPEYRISDTEHRTGFRWQSINDLAHFIP